MIGLSLGLILTTCVSTLALHEVRVLSPVAILYLEALILTMTTATSLALWVWVLSEASSQTVEATFTGCIVMMQGSAMLAFSRAELVWWLLGDRGRLVDQHNAGSGLLTRENYND